MQEVAVWSMMPPMRASFRSSLVAVSLAVTLLVVPASAADDPSTLLDEDLIEEAVSLLQEYYVDADALTRERLTIGAIRGLVESLGDDGHTEYLTELEYKAEQNVLEGVVAGIGIVLDQRTAAPTILSVIDGSPADRVGLRAGDVIVSVDGTDTARLPEGELADRIRGAPGTVVSLGIERAGATETETVPVGRAEIDIDPVNWALAPGSTVAVVRVVQFSVGSGHQVRSAVGEAVEAGATGVVLDLRGNPGGLVDEAINAASAFLDDGVVYVERARDGSTKPIRIEPGRVVDPDIPVVVLTDFGTASSAEILAAGLRDNGRATIVGETTFGTGTILNTIRLSDDSALRIGVREWLTPDGEAVFRVGVAPDEEVTTPRGATRLGPADLLGLTPAQFEESEDVPLRRAVRRAEAGG